jgi:hypothetical protein
MTNRKLVETVVVEANDIQVGGNHYASEMQHWDYVLANDIPYLEAQIIKYVTRWKQKDGMEDLIKATHFLMKLIEHNGGNLQELLAPHVKG